MNEHTIALRREWAKIKASHPLKIRLFIIPGFYVRVETESGRVRGFLSDRGGVGGSYIAARFDNAEEAGVAAADRGLRRYTICEVPLAGK